MEDIFIKTLEEQLKKIFVFFNWKWGEEHSVYFIILIYLIGIALVWPLCKKLKDNIVLKYNKQLLYKNLKQFYSVFEIEQSLKFFIETKSIDHDPSEYLEFKEIKDQVSKRQNLIKQFIHLFKQTASSKKFHLILADSGMGKTTFLTNLFLRYKKRTFFFHKKFEIKILPFGYRDFDLILKKYSEDENAVNTILLLDAFDEDIKSYIEPSKRLNQVLEIASVFQFVVITCRTQFFSSISSIPSITNCISLGPTKQIHNLTRYFLSPFLDEEVRKYLNKKYPVWNLLKRRNARNIVRNCPNLMARPMLLNYTEDLLDNEKEYTLSAEIYNKLVWSWIDRETSVDPEELYKCSLSMAIDMYEKRALRKGFYIPVNEIEKFKVLKKLNLSDVEIRSKSLLNSFENKYKFSHKSVLEFLLADNCLKNLDLNSINVNSFENPFTMDGLTEAARFYDEIFILKVTIPYLSEVAKMHFTPKEVITLETLDLSKTQINSLVFVKGFRSLKNLNISYTRITDLTPLIKLRALKEIKLTGSIIGKRGNKDENSKKQISEFKKHCPDVVIRF